MNAKNLIVAAMMSVSIGAAAKDGGPAKIAAPSPVLEKTLQNAAATFVSYKSREMADESDAKAGAESFSQALKKANYEVVQIKVVKEPTIAEDIFQYSFIVLYRAKDGFQFRSIQKYYRDGFSSHAAAKMAYDAWLSEQSKKGAVVLVAGIQPMSPPPSTYEMLIDYAYPLKAQRSRKTNREDKRGIIP